MGKHEFNPDWMNDPEIMKEIIREQVIEYGQLFEEQIEKIESYKKIIENMKKVHEIQGSNGNWNYDEYMHGMYNGMELMLSIAESREPIFKKKPEQWLRNKANLKK